MKSNLAYAPYKYLDLIIVVVKIIHRCLGKIRNTHSDIYNGLGVLLIVSFY